MGEAAPLPLIAVTMGDPAGIGPEVVLKAVAEPRVRQACRVVVVGDEALLRAAADRLGLAADWQRLDSIEDLDPEADLSCLHVGDCPPEVLFAARPTKAGGAAALDYISTAVKAALAGRLDAVATAPINKQSIAMAGSRFAGHTDMLAALTGAERAVMMLVGGPLRVALVTHHIPLSQVPMAIAPEEIVATARVVANGLRRFFGIAEPRVAVCGLNPHASDGSRFGDEELRLIEPAIVELRHGGLAVKGPLPPDTCFVRAARDEFDAVIAMYHDQGLIPLKLLAFESAVNVTLGLPIIRTSVDHGTAYDIAGRGVANPTSMVEAIVLAARMATAHRTTKNPPA